MGIITINITNRITVAKSGNVIGYKKAFLAHITGSLPNHIPVSLLKSHYLIKIIPLLGYRWFRHLVQTPGKKHIRIAGQSGARSSVVPACPIDIIGRRDFKKVQLKKEF